MSDARHRLPKLVLAELAGLAWRIEPGGRHPRLRIDGRLVAAIPCSASEYSKTWIRVRSTIRRYRKGIIAP
jgi:hypothetical protein